MRHTPLLPCLSILSLVLLPIACAAPPANPGAALVTDHPPGVMLVQEDADPPAPDTPAAPNGGFDDARPRAAATALLDSLDDAQRAKITFEINSDTRTDWHFVPRNRVGLPLSAFSDAQKHHLHALLQTALSTAGYLKATDILWLETVLAELENNPRGRDVGKYVVQLFGDPSPKADADAAWGWRLEGHHLSINLLYADGQVRVTPLFLGTNPAVVPTGPLAGKRILSEEHTLALELAASMSAEQREKMMLEGKPRDIITGPGRETAMQEISGIASTDLTQQQEMLLLQLIAVNAMNFNTMHFASFTNRWWQEGQESPIDQVAFAWAGPTDGSGPFYYRIHGPNFVIEYACQGANHVHAVFHDLTDPLGEDLLRKHFKQHEHQ